MSKLVVLVGAGRLGSLIVQHLKEQGNVTIRVLARDPAKAEALGAGVEVVKFDSASASEEETRKALHGAYSVISGLQGGPDVIVDLQLKLFRAAKASGVRRFIPSDFSYNIDAVPEGINVNSDWRRNFAKVADKEAAGAIEVVHIYNGVFLDPQVFGFLGLFNRETATFSIWGDDSGCCEVTTYDDTARFTALAATDSRSLPSRLHIRGDIVPFRDLATRFEKATGRKAHVKVEGSVQDLQKLLQDKLKNESQNMYAWLPLMYRLPTFSKMGLLGDVHNGLYPSVHPQTFEQAVKHWA